MKYSVATYFAVQSHPDADGAVYCYYPRSLRTVRRRSFRDLTYTSYFPAMKIARIVSQEAVFTCHPKPTEPLDPGDGEFRIIRIITPARAKPTFIVDLDALGINEASLFSDLDGLSRHMNWKFGLAQPVELADPEFLHKLAMHLLLDKALATVSDDDVRRFVDQNRQSSGQ
jgi:hypothetical protein